MCYFDTDKYNKPPFNDYVLLLTVKYTKSE